MRVKLEKGNGSQGRGCKDFLPSLLKPSKRMEIQEISGDTEAGPLTQSCSFSTDKGPLAPPLGVSHPRRKKTTVVLGTTESNTLVRG